MTDTPQNGDLGNYSGAVFVKANAEGQWCDPHGKPVFYQDEVVPVAERVVPTGWHDRVLEVAEDMQRVASSSEIGTVSLSVGYVRSWADILDPPAPKPRWPENTVLAYGGGLFRYIVNAEGVPCDACAGRPTTYPLDSDLWRVIGTFNPKEDA